MGPSLPLATPVTHTHTMIQAYCCVVLIKTPAELHSTLSQWYFATSLLYLSTRPDSLKPSSINRYQWSLLQYTVTQLISAPSTNSPRYTLPVTPQATVLLSSIGLFSDLSNLFYVSNCHRSMWVTNVESKVHPQVKRSVNKQFSGCHRNLMLRI